MSKHDHQLFPTIIKIFLLFWAVIILNSIFNPKIRERRIEKKNEMAIRQEQEENDRLILDDNILLFEDGIELSKRARILEKEKIEEQKRLERADSLRSLYEAQEKKQKELQRKLDEENRRKAKEEQRKYLQKAATATYDEGYIDGYDCGYDDGNMFQGYKYSFMEEKDLAKYSKEYIRGYRKGYHNGYVDGKEETDFVWY